MKRIVCLGILLILLIPVIVNAEECDNGKVYIDSISVEKANGVEEIEAKVREKMDYFKFNFIF